MSESRRNNLKERLTEVLALPKEIVLDLPKITLTGNSQFVIENYKGIIEYGSELIRINTAKGLVKIYGQSLEINTVTNEEIYIAGKIANVEFSS